MGPTIYLGGPTLSREHKRPLFAFVAVSVLCVLMLGHAIRSDAVLGLLLPSPATVAAAPVADTAAPARTFATVEGPQADPAVRQVLPAAAPKAKPRSKAKTRIGRSVMSSPVAVAAPAQVAAVVPAHLATAPPSVPAPQPQSTGGRKAQDTEKAAKQAAKPQKQAAKQAAKAQKQAAKQAAKPQKQAAKQAEEKSGGAKKGHAGTFTTRKAGKQAEKSQAQADKKTEDAAGEPGHGNGKPTGEAAHGSAPGQQG